MIDFRKEMLSYRPFNVEKLMDEGIKLTDNIKNSINLYNKALQNLWRNSEDIAIIELKKAISINPEFHEAINLLGLCYAYTKDYSKALDAFTTAENITGVNESASFYKKAVMELISGNLHLIKRESEKTAFIDNKDTKIGKNTKIKKNESARSIIDKKNGKYSSREKASAQKPILLSLNGSKKKNNSVFQHIFKSRIAIIAIILTAAVAVFALQLATGSIIPFKNVISSWFNDEANEEEKEILVPLAEFESLKNEFDQLQAEYEDSNKQLEYYKNVAKLISVEKLAAEGNFEEGADMLVEMRNVEFSGNEKEKYDSLCSNIFPRAALAAYNSGSDYYSRQMYEEAIEKLSKVVTYGDNWSYLNWTMYQIAMSYKELGKIDNAIKVFEDIIERFPGSNYEQYAKNWIAQLKPSEE